MRILPMKTNLFDRIFIGAVVMFGLHLLGTLRRAIHPLYVATIGSLIFLVTLIITG